MKSKVLAAALAVSVWLCPSLPSYAQFIGGGGGGLTSVDITSTNVSNSPTDGQIPIGKTSTGHFVLGTITAGDSVNVTNGSGAVTLAATHPSAGFVTGNYYSHYLRGIASTFSMLANTIYYIPIRISKTVTATELGIEVTTLSAGNSLTGIYSCVNGIPASLLLTGSEVSTGTTGLKTSSISYSLTPGWYFLAATFSATPTVRSLTVNGIPEFGTSSTTTAVTTYFNQSRTYDSTLPSTATPVAQSGTSIPFVWWRP